MIWTMVIWMAMQGQVGDACAQTPPSLCFYKGCEKMAVEIDGGCPMYADAPTQFKPLKPVEHVFEIRTRRTKITSNNTFDPAFLNCNSDRLTVKFDKQGDTDHEFLFSCTRITRELWMDGNRLGIIKGLD